MEKSIISSLLGILIGYLLGKMIWFYVCLFNKKLYHGPVAKEITEKIYMDKKGNCYQFITRVVPCPLE